MATQRVEEKPPVTVPEIVEMVRQELEAAEKAGLAITPIFHFHEGSAEEARGLDGKPVTVRRRSEFRSIVIMVG